MSRPLRRAAVLLVVAACSRPSPPAPLAPQAVLAEASPARGTSPGSPSATRLTPSPTARPLRPRPEPCLPNEPSAAPGRLAEEARQTLEAGEKLRALDCAEESVRLAPRLVSALAVRADALAALDRLDEARLAYARALALEPDHPLALLGAAELYVRRLSGDRDALEAGLEYARRGARAALRPPWRDRQLSAELLLLAGIAENDLGRSRSALGHLDRARAVLKDDPDVVYERGVALFELVRFGDAERAFERARALAPEDPWVAYQLGLLAERRGEAARAEELLARARRLDPQAFAPEAPVDERAFRAQVEGTVAALPAQDRKALEGVPVEVEDLPALDDLLAADPPLSPSILGLYRGPPQGEPCAAADGPRCRSIVLYRKNLVRFTHSRQELDEQVRVTLLHELGHLRGEDDDQLRDRGLE